MKKNMKEFLSNVPTALVLWIAVTIFLIGVLGGCSNSFEGVYSLDETKTSKEMGDRYLENARTCRYNMGVMRRSNIAIGYYLKALAEERGIE